MISPPLATRYLPVMSSTGILIRFEVLIAMFDDVTLDGTLIDYQPKR